MSDEEDLRYHRAVVDLLEKIERNTRAVQEPASEKETIRFWQSTLPTPASEVAAHVVEYPVCPNCWKMDTGHSWRVNGLLRYTCQPASEPAKRVR